MLFPEVDLRIHYERRGVHKSMALCNTVHEACLLSIMQAPQRGEGAHAPYVPLDLPVLSILLHECEHMDYPAVGVQ